MKEIKNTSFGDWNNHYYDVVGFKVGTDKNHYRYDKETIIWIYENVKEAVTSDTSYDGTKGMKDFMYSLLHPFFLVTKRVYNYFSDNNLTSNLLFKKVELSVEYRNIKIDGDYYLMLPKEVIPIRSFNSGIAYTTYDFDENDKHIATMRKIYTDKSIPFDKELFDLRLCISDDLVKSFKKQKFTGACIEELKKEDDKLEYCITYFENNYKNEKELIKAWFEHLSNSKIVKSKCKYIFYTFIEEEKGYSLSLGGYINKWFDEETYCFDKNTIRLDFDNINKMEFFEAYAYIQKILHDTYMELKNTNANNTFINTRAFMGYHDVDDEDIIEINL